ncbi:unnamed protein product [Microthlaspi erraticum]|uniref:MATH domain-containing protein n=1 Tax=Microthlaspi erraticum TaxID=1685480 RepID=A0A6D2JTH3_9BRAS|nr:unnamed protein product [Microthlaspi erraticum]
MSFTFEIDNFSEKEAVIESPKFSSGACDWCLEVFPKGYIIDDHLSLYVFVANPESLRYGWERRATYSFALLNESGKELFKTKESCKLFCDEFPGWGWTKAVPLKKLHKFMEKNKLIVKVKVKVVEVVDQRDVTGDEMFDIRGFQVPYPQIIPVGRLLIEQPEIAKEFRLKNQLVKTTYMNILLGLIETMEKPPHSIKETELSKARSELMELTEAGFKVDWLKTKLDEVSLERKKENTRVQELEKLMKNLTIELNEEKFKADTSAANVLSLEQTVSELEDELAEREDEVSDLNVKLNKEMRISDTYAANVLSLKAELKKEKAKSATWVAKAMSLDQMVSALQDELKKEKHVSDTSAGKVWSLEQKVSDLEDDLKKEKHGSDTSAAKVVLLEQRVSDLKVEVSELEDEVSELEDKVSGLNNELNKEKQTVLNLRAELKKEKAPACSWELLDYDNSEN